MGLNPMEQGFSLQMSDYILTYTNMHFNSHSLRSGTGFRSFLVEKENMLVIDTESDCGSGRDNAGPVDLIWLACYK